MSKAKPRNPRDSTAAVSAKARDRKFAILAVRLVALEQRIAAIEAALRGKR